MSTLLIIFLVIFILGPIAKAYGDRIARGPSPDQLPSVEEMARLREEVDRLSNQVSRLQDEQSFMVRLLSEGDRQKLLEDRTKSE